MFALAGVQFYVMLRMKDAEEVLSDLQSCDASKRNEAALKAIDLRLEEAVPVLLKSALNRDNIGFNGTLVYALGHFDCLLYFSQLVEISIFHGYEAVWAAMSIIDDQKLNPSKRQLEEALSVIESAVSNDLTEEQTRALDLIKERYYEDIFTTKQSR